MKRFSLFLSFIIFQFLGFSQNPIIPVHKGITDGHIRIYDGVAYMTACHDKSIDNKWFDIDYWVLYSSTNLVNWKLEYVLHPEETYIGKPYNQCWATDLIKRNGKYYWYFSEHNKQVGVMVAESPIGPWTDPLGKPLLEKGLVHTDMYDPGIVESDGDYYIVFGVWDYYIAKLNEDMISLAEKPKKIKIYNPRGPYNLDGLNKENPTDDKPYIHKYRGKFYLSRGCFYAMSNNIYGPYEYVDAILNDSSFADRYKEPTWPNGFRQGRHGSFFEMHNQWYYSYDDISQTDNRFFRSIFISYVHYKENGEMAPIRVDGIGVGQYDASNGSIEAEDYYPYREIIVADWFRNFGRDHHTGEVYLNGKSFYEVDSLEKMLAPVPLKGAQDQEGSLYQWYCESNSKTITIWANFHEFNPNKELVEINVRPAVFFPKKTGINYITVSGFKMSQAATTWAPPTAEQIGLIGPNWSKGWIIENNTISHSKCSGISLGKDRSTGQNYSSVYKKKSGHISQLEVVFSAIKNGWPKENVGSHIVRNNTISNCEQTGICGDMGAIFSQIYDNHIYDIYVKRQWGGFEMGGIKLHAPIDVLIRNNCIHNTFKGMWIDWQCSGHKNYREFIIRQQLDGSSP